MFRVPLSSRFSFCYRQFEGEPAKLRQKNEWHFLALDGTPGNVSSANSPWSERTSIGRKSLLFWDLCRWNPPVSCNLRPVNRVGNAHPAFRDVSRGESRGQEGVQPDRARWRILEHVCFQRETGLIPRLFNLPRSVGDLTTRGDGPVRAQSTPMYNIPGFADFINAPIPLCGGNVSGELCSVSTYTFFRSFIFVILLRV
jgi:hypothetical protein